METASLEGTEEVVEGSAFVRLFEVVDWLFASQIKDSTLAISTRVKNTFFGIAKPPLSYKRILNKRKMSTFGTQRLDQLSMHRS
jgi:hypothetical protein